ncbi:hypothetical protein Tco_1266308 [Tanacetum coccineum]
MLRDGVAIPCDGDRSLRRRLNLPEPIRRIGKREYGVLVQGKKVLGLVVQYGISKYWIWRIECLWWIRRIHFHGYSVSMSAVSGRIARIEDNDDNAMLIGMDSRLFRVKEVGFWVKKGFSAHVSTGPRSGGSIRRIQVLDMAY